MYDILRGYLLVNSMLGLEITMKHKLIDSYQPKKDETIFILCM
jgi:hypothetical protein